MKFIVLSYPRSGTTLFSRLLNSHSDIAYLHEPCTNKITINKEEFLKRFHDLWFQLKITQKPCCGFELCYKDIKNQYRDCTNEVRNYINVNKVKTIQLIRRDLLRQALSKRWTLLSRRKIICFYRRGSSSN
jgi:hypothetical protein